MRAKHFDVVILGENTAGLVAAALLSSRKYRVLLVRDFVGPGRSARIGRHTRRTRPLMPGFFERPVPAAVIRELNLGHRLRSSFKPAMPLFQLLDSSHRVTVHEDRVRLVAELQREFGRSVLPDDVGNLLAHLEDEHRLMDKLLVPGLPYFPDGIREKWDLAARLKEHRRRLGEQAPQQDELARLCSDTVFGRLMGELAGFAADARGGDASLLRRSAGGLVTDVLYQVGAEDIEDMLLEQYDKRGGKVVDHSTFQETELGKAPYKFHDTRTTYSADAVIAAFDYFLLSELGASRKLERFVAAQLARVRLEGLWITLSLVYERDTLPEGLGTHAFIRPGEGLPLMLCVRDLALAQDAEVERVDLWLPVPTRDYTPGGLEQLQQAAIDRLLWFTPFAEGRLRHVYREPAPKLEEEGPYLPLAGRRLVYGLTDSETFNGVPCVLPLKNGYLAGPEVFPELGLEGEFIAGWHIARHICTRNPQKDDLK